MLGLSSNHGLARVAQIVGTESGSCGLEQADKGPKPAEPSTKKLVCPKCGWLRLRYRPQKLGDG